MVVTYHNSRHISVQVALRLELLDQLKHALLVLVVDLRNVLVALHYVALILNYKIGR